MARDATFRASLERSCELFDAAGDLVGSCAARGWLFQTARSATELEDLLAQVQEQLERHGPLKDPQVESRIIRNFNADYRLPARHPLWTFGIERADGLCAPVARARAAGAHGGLRGARVRLYQGEIAKLRSVIAAVEADVALPGVSVRDRYVFLNVRSIEAFLSGAFESAHEATALLRADANANPVDQMGPVMIGAAS